MIRNGEYCISFNVRFAEFDDDGKEIDYPDLSIRSIELKLRGAREIELYDLYHAGVLSEVEYNQKRIEVVDGVRRALEVYQRNEIHRLEVLKELEAAEDEQIIDEQMQPMIV